MRFGNTAPDATPLAVLLLLLLLHPLALEAAVQQRQQDSIRWTEAFISGAASGKAVFAPGVALGGEPLAVVTARNGQGCAQACREEIDECGYFNYCEAPEGCTLPGNETIGYQECVLYDGNCTLIPPVAARGGDPGVTAGFPLLFPEAPVMPGAIMHEARGLVGGDFECAGSILPGMCAVGSVYVAVPACSGAFAATCSAIVVYSRGMDGCSQEVSVLKTAMLAPSISFMSPTVYTLEMEARAPTGAYLLYSEGAVIAASEDAPSSTVAANASTPNSATNATNAWLGCIVATVPAVMSGDVVATLDGIATPEACCRACRARAPCNAWNGCFKQEPCRYVDLSQEVVLKPGQCELRKQGLLDPERGGPPYLLAKGEAADGLTAGVPISAPPGPELPGYTRYTAGGLFAQPGCLDCTVCVGTLQTVLQECIVRGEPAQLADNCTQDAKCVAWIWKDLFWRNEVGAAFLRGVEGANVSRMVRTPASTTYFKQSAAADSGAAGSTHPSGGLPAGAIAGITVGCAAAAVAAALGGWALLRRRQRQQGSGTRAVVPAASAVSVKTGEEGGDSVLLAIPPSPDSCQDPQHSGQRSVLSTPQASGITASPTTAAAAASVGASSSSEAAGSALLAGPPRSEQLCSTGSGSVVLGHAVIGRPVAASPFAAARQSRMARASSAAAYSSSAAGGGSEQTSMRPSYSWAPDSMGFPSLSRGPRTERAPSAATAARVESAPSPSPAPGAERAPSAAAPGRAESGPGTEVQVELPQVLSELMQQRAAEDQASLVPLAPTPTGEGCMSLSTSAGSGGLDSSPLPSATLPASLLASLIPRSEVEYQRRPDGELAVLGEGASGRVIRATYNCETVAAKEVEIGRGIEVQEVFVSEAKHMQAMRHPNIVTFYGCVLDHGQGILIMELMEGRDLGSALRLRNAQGQRVFGWYKHGCRVAWEVSKALNYLHARSFVHMDVKASNVLLTSQGQGKLGDVGLARLQTKTCLSDLPRVVGTFAWVAPEVLMGGRNCSQAVDIYSFGVLLWEIITGERPVRGHLRAPIVPDECPQQAADLMTECGALDPAERPTAQQCLLRLQAMLAAQQHGGT